MHRPVHISVYPFLQASFHDPVRKITRTSLRPAIFASICLATVPPNQVPVHPSILSSKHPAGYPSIHPLINQFIRPSIRPTIQPLKYLHQSIYSSIIPLIHPPIQLQSHPLHPSSHTLVLPSANLATILASVRQ
jgi:hypothetical protein